MQVKVLAQSLARGQHLIHITHGSTFKWNRHPERCMGSGCQARDPESSPCLSSVPFILGLLWLQQPTEGHLSTQRTSFESGCYQAAWGPCQLLPTLGPSDTGIQTLAPFIWPVGTGGGSWLGIWEWVVNLCSSQPG